MEKEKYIQRKTKAKRQLTVFLIVSAIVFFAFLLFLAITPSEDSALYDFWGEIRLVISTLFIFFAVWFLVKLSKMIQIIMEEKNKMMTYVGQRIETIDKFSGEEFEELLCFHFKRLGYRVRITPQTRDYGADLFLEQNGERVVVQAKRYNTKVPIGAIQEIVAAKAFYKAEKALVVTNSTFTKSAIQLAEANDVELWDRYEIIKRFSL